MTTEIETFDIGDKVKHPKFGTGTVVFRTGEGEKQKVTVKFGSEVGEKKLLVGLANLKLISERPTLQAAEAPVEAVPGRARLGKPEDEDEDDDEDIEAISDDEDEAVEEEEEEVAEDEEEE